MTGIYVVCSEFVLTGILTVSAIHAQHVICYTHFRRPPFSYQIQFLRESPPALDKLRLFEAVVDLCIKELCR